MAYTINDVTTHRQVIDTLVKLSESERQAIVDEWNAPDTRPYAEKRWGEYPTVDECVHAILDDQLDALQVKRQAVKDKYPKP